MRKLSFLKRDFNLLTGVVHNHSNFSYDCDVSAETIIKAAHKNELDYLTINDHNVEPHEDSFEKALRYFKEQKNYNPFLIPGAELNDLDGFHHLLVFNSVAEELSSNKQTGETGYGRDGRDKEDEVTNAGKARKFNDNKSIENILKQQKESILFAAHPYERRACSHYPFYDWRKKELLSQVSGIEIWNYTSSWLSKLNPKINGLLLLLFPNLFVKKPFPESLRLWDELTSKGYKTAAIGSTDAHGTKHKLLFFKIKILTHKQLFKTIRTNVLLEEGTPVNKQTILNALATGKSYVVNYRLGVPFNFYTGICKKKEKAIIMGEEIRFQEGLELYYRLPSNSEISLVKNGEIVSRQSSVYGSFPIDSDGIYRLEITRYGLGWIYTNNFYVLP